MYTVNGILFKSNDSFSEESLPQNFFWNFPSENKLFLKVSRRNDHRNQRNQITFQTCFPEINYNINLKDPLQIHQILST